MRYRCVMATCLLAFAALCYAAPVSAQSSNDEKVVGTWAGTWEGAGGSGNLEVTFEKPKDGTLGGMVSVLGEPAYKATFKTVKFEAGKMTATYDYPPEPNVDVVLAATFEGNECTGTWSAREKSSNNEVASGTWKATRKE